MAPNDSALPPAVVLGGGPTALPVVRRLGREGVEVHALGGGRDAVRYSRYARFVDLGAGRGIQERWLSWLEASAPKGAVVLAASDNGAELIALNRPRLVALGLVPMELNDEAVLIMLDKQRTSELAARLGVPCPRTVRVGSVDDVEGELDFPLGLKPVRSHLFHAHFRKKVFAVRDVRELREKLELTSRLGFEMIATELVEGPDAGIATYCAYLDERSQVMCELTKCKPRQYPAKAGTGTLHVSDWSPEVAELGRRFLTGAGVRGHANIEVKRDVRDGRMKLIECNYRFLQGTAMLQAAGFDIVGFTYNRLAGRPLPSMDYRRGVRGIFVANDLRAFRQYRRIGELTTREYQGSLASPHHLMQMSWDDPAPALRWHWGLVRKRLPGGRR
jgi:predicted ATP-grasp superfamily ATP-dependent carboligase